MAFGDMEKQLHEYSETPQIIGRLPDGRYVYEQIVSGTSTSYSDVGNRRQFLVKLKPNDAYVIDVKGYVYQDNGNRVGAALPICSGGAYQAPAAYQLYPEFATYMHAHSGSLTFATTTASGLTRIKYWAIIQYYEGSLLP